MGESLKAKFSRAYENARESSKVREAALLALMEVSRARSLPRPPSRGEGEPERHWGVTVVLPGGRTLKAQGRTVLEAAELLVQGHAGS